MHFLFSVLEFRFEQSSYLANEGSPLTVKVLKQGSNDLPVTINITAVELSTSPNDFVILANSITFLANENEQLINVYLLSDTDSEETEHLSLLLVSNDERVQVQGPANISILNAESGE